MQKLETKVMETNKDWLFWWIVAIWAFFAVMTLYVKWLDTFYVNNAFIILICVLILAKNNNDKFNNWLNKKR